MASLEQILYFRNLTGVIESIKAGIPCPLPDAMLKSHKQVSGNRAEYFKITGTRQVARIVQYGSPAQRQGLREVDSVPITLMHSFEDMAWPLSLMIALTQMSELKKDAKGTEQAEYQSRNFKKRFVNLRQVAAMQALFTGILYWDKNGNLLPSSAGAAASVDFSVPAGNKTTVGGLITGWNTTSTDIIGQIEALQAKAVAASGYPITTAYYANGVASWIGANTTALQYLKFNLEMGTQYVKNKSRIPQGFGGIANWIYAGDTFYADSTNTNRVIMPAATVVFTPDVDEEWWDIYEGSFLVPKTVTPQMNQSASDMLSEANLAEVFGQFGYGQLSMNPPTVVQYAGDTFLPILKVPGAIYQTTPT
jgi:hypothetical protein